MAGVSIWQLLIIAIIIALLFGTNKLRNLGSDLGSSIRGFKKAMSDEDDKQDQINEEDDNCKSTLLAKKQQTTVSKDDLMDK